MKEKKYQDKEWLYKKYYIDKLSTYEIANICNCGTTTVGRWMEKYGFDRRTSSEARTNHVNLSNKAVQFIEGDLLGDGCMRLPDAYNSPMLLYSSKYKEYLEWTKSRLSDFDIQSTDIYTNVNGDNGSTYHQFNSYAYHEFIGLYKKWYVGGKKIIPNIELTPIHWRQWYIGDGSLPYGVTIRNKSFGKESMEGAIDQLERSGIKSKLLFNNGYIDIYIRSSSRDKFLSYIGDCPNEIENIYGYKWGV